MRKPCLDCGRVTATGSRCESCQSRFALNFERGRANRIRNREHYAGDYQRRAREVRETAVACWLCGEGWRPDDPWQADHVEPGNPESILAAAHRSCNIGRANRARTQTNNRA